MVAAILQLKLTLTTSLLNPVTHQPATSAAQSSQMIISQEYGSTNTQGAAEVTMTPVRNGSYCKKASLKQMSHLRNN